MIGFCEICNMMVGVKYQYIKNYGVCPICGSVVHTSSLNDETQKKECGDA